MRGRFFLSDLAGSPGGGVRGRAPSSPCGPPSVWGGTSACTPAPGRPGGDPWPPLSLQDEHCFYNGKPHWESSWPAASAAGCFVPFAVCVVSRFPYYNALRDCLSW